MNPCDYVRRTCHPNRLIGLTPGTCEIAWHSSIARSRDWIESLLPKTRATLDSELPLLNARLQAQLQGSRLIDSNDSFDNFRPGFLTRVELSHPSDDPDKLAVIVGVEIPCGADEVVYLYDYSQGPRRRVLESHGAHDHDERVYNVRLSKPDALGNQLFLTSRLAVQCAGQAGTGFPMTCSCFPARLRCLY